MGADPGDNDGSDCEQTDLSRRGKEAAAQGERQERLSLQSGRTQKMGPRRFSGLAATITLWRVSQRNSLTRKCPNRAARDMDFLRSDVDWLEIDL